MSWTEKMQLGKTFRFFDQTTNSDADSGAVVSCLTYRIATPPPPALSPPPPPPRNAPGGSRISESALAGTVAGSCVVVVAALCAGYSAYRTRVFESRRKPVLVTPETSRRFLM
jgi:hypothetical protein